MAGPIDSEDRDVDMAVRALAQAELQRLSDHPDANELADYSLGALSGEMAERIEEHVTFCSECASAILDLMAFSGAPARGADPAKVAPAREWKELMIRLERRPAADRSPRKRELSKWALAASLVACVGFLGWGLRLNRQLAEARGPQADVVLADLVPRGTGTERSGKRPAQIRILPGAGRLVLLLNLGDLRTFPRYRMELQRSSGEILWGDTDVRRLASGAFLLDLPVEVLDPGEYEIRIAGLLDGDEVPLAVYSFASIGGEGTPAGNEQGRDRNSGVKLPGRR